MLDSRAQHLLKTLVERYVAEGQPVGSRVLSRHSGLDLSPATIRNVMADLEEMGLIASPHTSAGRVPTPRGYRFFVDSLMVVKPLEQGEIHRLEGEFSVDRPQQLVSAAASLLSQLTQFAGVVATPKRREAVFRHLEFLRLSDRRVLLIIVAPDGDVQNRILHTDRSYSPTQLIEATNFFNQNFAGQSLTSVRERLTDELRALRDDVAGLMKAAVDAGEGALAEGEALVVTGERNLLHAEDLASNMERLRRLFDLKMQHPGYMSIYLFPFAMIGSTYGYSYAIQHFAPGRTNDECHFSSRMYSSRLREGANAGVLASFFDSSAQLNRQVFDEDHAICRRVSRKSLTPPFEPILATSEVKIRRFREAMADASRQ